MRYLNFHLGTNKKLHMFRASLFQNKIKLFSIKGQGVCLRKEEFALPIS